MIKFTEQQFKEIKEKGEVFYKSLDQVYCPYLKGMVTFNARGLEHLKFKRLEKTRSERDQYMRFKLIHLAPEVLKSSHTVQGILETQKFERIRVSSRTDTILKPVMYHEFIAVIKRNRVRVIVKEIDGGTKFFWSIIPFWKTNEITKERKLYDEDLEYDHNIISDLDIFDEKQKSPVA